MFVQQFNMVLAGEATFYVSGTQAPILWVLSPLHFSKFSPFNLQMEKEIAGSHVRRSHGPGLEVAYITSVLIHSITTQHMTPYNGKGGWEIWSVCLGRRRNRFDEHVAYLSHTETQVMLRFCLLPLLLSYTAGSMATDCPWTLNLTVVNSREELTYNLTGSKEKFSKSNND